ncbi:hypothetical protein FRACYDRAFT_252615 [Fragilariopsis cylindrus CCMP1102]|uniref:Uncharacterized protein n=1 Tax=Fragilariopsis cylindrus CCMP1102 TaxID=635003 RepID=A0A1E7EN34_9STRA|nr:hypothetical protein FRACYDRAFT_252615 [Fragilariopsis cylindrus CCMP1102]|eukprot:OEU06983.1 hypothetical protein FRACYDRAFT_252615 [Fragilariopsis cylindrus CCMP1102]
MPNHKNNNNNQGLFPWRSSSELLDRLIVGTNEYDKKGLLLGGNLTSSNPTMDFYATSYFFLRIPALDLLFFRNAVETDLLESMSYSFQYAIENAVVKGNNGNNGLLERMMEPKLAKLFNAAREFGKDSLQVKLESQHLQKYKRMITLISEGEDEEGSRAGEGMQLSRELMIDFRNTKKGYCENTVIVQVLIPCNETFYVKDINNDNDNDNNDDEATSNIIQGTMNRRKVIHLVRFEQVTKTYIINNGRGLFPFRHELGEWQITDIDDLCNGNLLL